MFDGMDAPPDTVQDEEPVMNAISVELAQQLADDRRARLRRTTIRRPFERTRVAATARPQ
jgi:hypothetical protein